MIPKKSFGQHFLINKGIIKKIADSVALHELIIEIGPGTGALTEKLIERFGEKNLILVEADKSLVPDLELRFPKTKIELGDAARIDFDKITAGKKWTLVGNLPYNASAAILENAYTSTNKPVDATVMVQKEQAQKMLAVPGDMSVLSVAMQMYCKVKRLFDVSPGSFFPPPKVNSTVLHLNLKTDISSDSEEIIGLAKIGFSARRKQLCKNLSSKGEYSKQEIASALIDVGVDPLARAQELSIENWKELYKILQNFH